MTESVHEAAIDLALMGGWIDDGSDFRDVERAGEGQGSRFPIDVEVDQVRGEIVGVRFGCGGIARIDADNVECRAIAGEAASGDGPARIRTVVAHVF